MLLIRKETVAKIMKTHWEVDLLYAVALPQGFLARSNQALLILKEEVLVILYINKLTNKEVTSLTIPYQQLKQPSLSDRGLSKRFSFQWQEQNYAFHILKRILTLGNIQRQFLRGISQALGFL